MIALLLVSFALAAQDKVAGTNNLVVPGGARIELDGKLGESEWSGALNVPLSGGGALLLRHDEHNMYVGVRGKGMGLVHVYVKDGDKVVVRHASAALGTAIYAKNGAGKWQPTQPFPAADAWALRDTGLTPELSAARDAHLKREGWVATNMAMGKAEFEFVLARKSLGAQPVLAVAFASFAAPPLLFPTGLKDSCTNPQLLMGQTPGDLDFRTETWGQLRFAGDTEKGAVPK